MSAGTWNEPQHSNAAAVHSWNSSDLSRFQSLTEPSAAHEARLTSFLSRDTVALGWNTMAPTLVLCPEGKQNQNLESATRSWPVLQKSSISLALVREVPVNSSLCPQCQVALPCHPQPNCTSRSTQGSIQNEGLEPSKIQYMNHRICPHICI